MSETIHPVDNEKLIDPIDEALTIETPAANTALETKKKRFPVFKFLAFTVGFGLLVLVATSYYAPSPKNTRASTSNIRATDAQAFVATPVTTRSTNAEAASLADKKEKERAERAKKEPGASFIQTEPFGDAVKSEPLPAPTATPSFQAPPPPVPFVAQTTTQPQITSNSNGDKEDPALLKARAIYAEATAPVEVGVSKENRAIEPGVAGTTTLAGTTASITDSLRNITPKDADIGAGEIKYAVLTSGLNTLVPQTPPRAVIHGGALDGAVLLGMIENANNQYMVLRFSRMTLGKKTYSISAIAVNLDMQDAGLQDEVKSHLFEKTAIQAGVGFIQSFGAAKLQENTTLSQSNSAFGSSASSSTPARTNRQTAIIALGGAAQAVQPAIEQLTSNIKPEVIIHPNKELGILFMEPVFLK